MEDHHDAQFRQEAEGVLKTAIMQARSFALWLLAIVSVFGLLSTAMSGPAIAHGKKKHAPTEQVQQPQQKEQQAGSAGAPSSEATQGGADGHGMMDGMDMDMDRSEMPFFQRLFDWIGRLHPFIVHFPIAFFPAALLTAVAGRRRPSFAAPVQFLVVAGGVFAPLAAAAGFIGGMTADPDPVLNYHRWLGVAVGIGGVGLGIWAWRRPWEDRGAGMILALTVMTIAIAVQGFLGAAVTHGMEHLMF